MTEFATTREDVMPVGYVHLTIHLVNGGQHRFVQTNPETAQGLLTQVRPERIFAQKQILIAGPVSVTVIPTDSIERIDIRSDPLPDWQSGANGNALREITETEFERVLRREVTDLPTAKPAVFSPPSVNVGVCVELRSGGKTYFRVRPRLSDSRPGEAAPEALLTPDDSHSFLRHLFDRPILFGVMEDAQGIFLINPANAVRFVASPPPPVRSLSSVWHAEAEA